MAALATHARLAGCQAGQQRGAVLGVALLLLTVLTLLALGASQLRRTQETATRSIQQRALALPAFQQCQQRLAARRGGEIAGKLLAPPGKPQLGQHRRGSGLLRSGPSHRRLPRDRGGGAEGADERAGRV